MGCYPGANVYYGGDDDFDCEGMQLDDQDQPQVYEGDDGGNESEPPPPPPDYQQPEYQPPVQRPQTAPSANQIATTIIFNDGRTPEQIHDYALTGTTLYVLDERRQDIPLSQVDIAATEKANRAAGVEFEIPQNSQISQ